MLGNTNSSSIASIRDIYENICELCGIDIKYHLSAVNPFGFITNKYIPENSVFVAKHLHLRKSCIVLKTT